MESNTISSEYIVIRCSRKECSRFTYCKAKQKTKKCPYCGRTINLEKVQKISVDTNPQARKLVQEFNKKLGELQEPWWYKAENDSEI
ncbi:MAG: DUF1922 domain-containing protein [Candidatus Heimdallarchaeaceae archaeon]